MTEEIIIDGEMLELDADFKGVQMVLQSPYLTELKSIVSNRTNTVTLPATERNKTIIGCNSLQQDSVFPYRKHRAIYKRDGVQMFNGYATLLSVTDKQIQMCFTWGNVDAFQKLFDTRLRDLADFYQGTTHRTEQYISYGNAPYCPALIDCGTGKHQPAKMIKDIMMRIQQKCGITGLSNVFGMWNKLGLLLPTRIGDATTKELQGISYGTISLRPVEVTWSFSYTAMRGVDNQTDVHNLMDSDGAINVQGKSKLRIKFNGTLEITQPMTASGVYQMWLLRDTGSGFDMSNGTKIADGINEGTVSGGARKYKYVFDNYDQEFDVSDTQYVCIIVSYDITKYTPTIITNTLTSKLILDPDELEEVVYGTGLNAYPMWANMPDMSCGDFVKAMMIPFGLFAYCKSDTEIAFTTFTELYNNKSVALDWTDKMITLQPKERRTALDGYAQRNFLKYKEDEGVPVGMIDSEIDCDDETLNAEATLYESPFTLPYDNKVPVYSQEALSEEQFAGDERAPRLIGVATNRTASTVILMQYQSWLKWSALLYSYYQQYQRVVNKPVVIKADFLITTADLNALDMRVPVYLKQTGRYYAIRKLTTKNAKVAEAELIELK